MGAKTWMLAYVEGDAKAILKSGPSLDRQQADETVRQLFPSLRLEPVADGTLENTCPPRDEIYIACFPGLTIVAASELAVDRPSQLAHRFLEFANGRTVYLHAMHSVVDWFAYAIWRDGKLVRSLSLSPDSGIIEDEGQRQEFELPYWSGAHAAVEEGEEDAYPFPFHPLELGEAALGQLFGYQIEGEVDAESVQAFEIPMMRFKRKKSWLRFW